MKEMWSGVQVFTDKLQETVQSVIPVLEDLEDKEKIRRFYALYYTENSHVDFGLEAEEIPKEVENKLNKLKKEGLVKDWKRYVSKNQLVEKYKAVAFKCIKCFKEEFPEKIGYGDMSLFLHFFFNGLDYGYIEEIITRQIGVVSCLNEWGHMIERKISSIEQKITKIKSS